MIPYGKHFLDETDIAAVSEVLRGGFLTQGPKIADFEAAVASYVGARFAVAVSSGTAGLHLACLAADLGAGDMVATSPITFVASANCACYVGARPVFADVDPRTLNLSAESLEEVYRGQANIKAIVPVHYAGLPCDMSAIRSVADARGAVIIEDAAHALGASYADGGKVGNCSNSLMTVFSFHPVKAIAAGEGGLITTNDAVVYKRLLRLRSHGINKGDDSMLHPDAAQEDGEPNLWYYEMQELGFNYRITDIQSALALSQLGKLERFLARRRELAHRYDGALGEIATLKPAQSVGRDLSAHHLYPVRVDYRANGFTRTRLMHRLREMGIGTQVHYIPVYLQPYYRNLGYKPGACPEAEAYYREALSLPLYYSLADSDQDKVVRALAELLQ
ncbi:MAG: UDP-4-amino-4,6-dideoxy-N-acetyl-beta-L-altrosamine transaminase [Gammaproteobacteria bacterium]|nr:UDP-4-amino-4,6-dideoxy-N-acetyl-beta-L-altrosamine transaminase [Gammaproteobacteria bacterium]